MLLCTARESQVPSSELGSYYIPDQFTNSEASLMAVNQELEAGGAEETSDEAEEVRIPSFEPKEVEGVKLVAVDSHSAAIRWHPIAQLDDAEGLDGTCSTSTSQPAWSIIYSVEVQERQAGESSMAHTSGSFSCCYKGSECYTEVKGLRPGRTYAFRVICQAAPPEELVVSAVELPPSATILVSTPAIPPSVPHAPGLASREKTSLTLKWAAPAETGGCPITFYELAFGPLAGTAAALPSSSPVQLHGRDLHIIYKGREPRYKLSQLPPGSTYHAALQAVNKIGESGWSTVAEHQTKATVPAPPEEPYAVSKTASSALIEWKAPVENGSRVFEHQLQIDDGQNGAFQTVYTGEALRYRAEGLQSGVVYRCRVIAINEEGKSLPSKPGSITTAAAAPSVPVAPTVMGFNRTYVTVKWRPPETDGGSPLTGYQVELQPKSKAALEGMPSEWVTVSRAPATTCMLGGLRPGCVYRWRVRASNSAGSGKPCVPLEFKTAPDVPEAPGEPIAATRAPNSLTMEWASPSHDGGSDIHQYRLEMSEAETVEDALAAEVGNGSDLAKFRTVAILDAAEHPCCRAHVEHLLPGKQYLFRAQATSKQGRSDYSPICVVNTKAAAPDRPAPPQLLGAQSSSLSIAWTPSAANGAPISNYNLHLWPAAVAGSPAKHAAPADQPVPSESQASENGEEVPAQDGAAVSVAPSSTSEESPSESGRKPRQKKQPAPPHLLTYSGLEQTFEARGLEPDTEYLCKLRCSNAAGSSYWSEIAALRTAAAAPTAPGGVQAKGVSSSQLQVEWQAPAKDNGAEVTAYHVEVCCIRGRQQGSWCRVYTGPDLSCLVADLKSGRKHLVRVRAVNVRGQGPWGSVAEAETWAGTPDAPDPPTFTSRAATSVRVQWQPVLTDNGAPIVRYRLEGAAEGEAFQRFYSGTDFSHKTEGLSPGCSYSFRVLAINAVGEGPWSNTACVSTTLLPPVAPTSVSVAVDEDDRAAVLVSWEPGKTEGKRSEAASHEVVATSDSDPPIRYSGTCSGRSQSLQLAKLQPGLHYQVRVRSTGVAGGHSEWSEPCSITMPGSPPSVPSLENLAAMTRSNSAASVKAPLSRRSRSNSLELSSSQTGKLSRRGAPSAGQMVKARGKPARVTMWTPAQRFYRRWRTYVLSVLGGVSVIVFCYCLVLVNLP